MLPKSLESSYARYKDDTNTFATWLLRAAEKCGHHPDLPVVEVVEVQVSVFDRQLGRFKPETNDKAAPLPALYRATIADLRILGEVVAKSKIRVPDAVLAVARRAIKLRKDSTLFYIGKDDGNSNTKHAFLVQVLEEICGYLERRSTGNPSGSKAASAPAGDADAQSWQNKFASLTVEDPEDVDASEPANAVPKLLPRLELVEEEAPDPDGSRKSEYHLGHVYFKLYCLFRDLKNMRDFISSTWAEYRDNKVDLMSASVVTDTALQFARDMIQAYVVNDLPQAAGDEVLIQEFMYLGASNARGIDTHSVHMADVAEWCYMPTFCVLVADCIPMMQQGSLPVYKKQDSRVSIPEVDTAKMNWRQRAFRRYKGSQTELLETFPEFCMLGTFQLKMPVRDEITQAFVEFFKAKEPTLWTCFAGQVLVDVNHAMRASPTRALIDLRVCGLRISKILDDFKDLSKTHPKHQSWPESGDEEIDKIQSFVDIFINTDPLKVAWDHLAERSQTNQPMEAHQKNFYLSRNPVLCGLFMLHLNLRMQRIGQTLVSVWTDVQQLAFLYNLVQILPGASPSWPDMERIIQIHGENHIFGGNRPKDASENHKRLETVLDVKKGWLVATTKMTELFHEQYRNHNSSRPIISSDFDKLMDSLVATPSVPTKKQAAKKSSNDVVVSDPQHLLERKWSNKHSVGMLQFLALVKNKIQQEEPVLMFNYLGMHRRSIELLRLIRAKLEKDYNISKFPQVIPAEQTPNDTFIAYLVLLIHRIFYAQFYAQGYQQPGLLPHGRDAGSPMVLSCGEVMQEYLATKGGVACKELEVFCKNKNSSHVEMNGDGAGAKDEETDKKFMYWFALEEVLDPNIEGHGVADDGSPH